MPMLQIDDTVVSLDLFNECFVCDLASCKGICCVEGDAGAPLEAGEADKLEEILPAVWDDLSEAAREVIRRQGVCYVDEEGDTVTSIVDGRECVFTCTDADGMCHCAVEKAYREGRIDFYKPISCHLYPVRVHRYNGFVTVNYHRWEVCQCARTLGRRLGVPVYRFLKEPLVRRFGEEWYRQMEIAERELKQHETGKSRNHHDRR